MDSTLGGPIEGEGRPLDETTRGQMESLVGHNLKELRVHDSRQAGEVARRLGADAFTVGSNVFARPGRMATATMEGAGLLAHEATHVVQQSKPRELAVDEPRRPLVPRRAVRASRSPGATSNAAMSAGSVSPEGQPRASARGSLRDRGDTDGGAVTVQRSLEAEAEVVEHVARDSVQRVAEEETGGVGEGAGKADVDVEALGRRLFRIMRLEALLERERR
jgi:hypothetical protein